MSCCGKSNPTQIINTVYKKDKYYGGNYPMERTQADRELNKHWCPGCNTKQSNSFVENYHTIKPNSVIENYCTNQQAQAALSLQDNDNPTSYSSFLC